MSKNLDQIKGVVAEYNKSLQEEKKLLLVDKKHFQDLSLEQTVKIAELSQIHCNAPDHFEMIGMRMKVQTNDLDL